MTPEQQFLHSKLSQVFSYEDSYKTAGTISNIARRLFNVARKGTAGTVLGGLGGAGVSIASGGLSPLMMIGGGAALGGLAGVSRGLFQRLAGNNHVRKLSKLIDDPSEINALQELATGIPSKSQRLQRAKSYMEGLSPAVPVLAGGGLGYALADEDKKTLGTILGLGAGAIARPLLIKAR